MQRKTFAPRPNYVERFNNIGFQYHDVQSSDGNPYWTEGVAYEFTLSEVDAIEEATNTLHEMCLETVGAIVESGDYPKQFLLSDMSKTLIERSWNNDDMHIYGRFDFLVEPNGNIKLYEYNADTPTSLVEASIAQWDWLQSAEGVPNRDQFNSIHEKLIERWKEVKEGDAVLNLLATDEAEREDWGNVEYMADVAMQAGWHVNIDSVEEGIGWDSTFNEFVNRDHYAIKHVFKLYPLEWMMAEEFGKYLLESKVQWFEPAWKMLLSNKAILPVLWERYENHPNLLPSYFDYRGVDYVRKPILGREGANVHQFGSVMEGSHFIKDYDEGYISQSFAPLPNFDGMHPVVGSWVIGDEAVGIGIREDSSLISGNGSHFVPHYFVEG